MDVAIKKPSAEQKRKASLREEISTEARRRESKDALTLAPVQSLHFRVRSQEEAEEDRTREIDEEIRACQKHYDDNVRLDQVDARDVLAWCREIKDQELRAERIAEEAKILAARAKARYERTKFVLWPSIQRWAEEAPRSTPKSISFEGSTLRLQFRKGKGKVTVTDKNRALDWASRQFGDLEAAGEEGVVKTRHEVSVSGLRDWIEENIQEQIDIETGESVEILPVCTGANYEAPGERLSIVQRKGK